jgi:hypothetical protein
MKPNYLNLNSQQSSLWVCWNCKELTNAQLGITPKILHPTTYQTWILPSSRRLGFLHLTIHVRYVEGQTMLIRCCFAIIVMVNTIYSASSRNLLKFSLTFGTIHHVLIYHLEFYSNHATFFPAQVWGGYTWEFPLNLLLYIVYICVCISFWFINFYLWLVLVFLFSKVYYGFTPLRHETSWHYTSWQLTITNFYFNLINIHIYLQLLACKTTLMKWHVTKLTLVAPF